MSTFASLQCVEIGISLATLQATPFTDKAAKDSLNDVNSRVIPIPLFHLSLVYDHV